MIATKMKGRSSVDFGLDFNSSTSLIKDDYGSPLVQRNERKTLEAPDKKNFRIQRQLLNVSSVNLGVVENIREQLPKKGFRQPLKE